MKKPNVDIVTRLANYYISKAVTGLYIDEKMIDTNFKRGLRSTIRKHVRKEIPEHLIAKAIFNAYEDPWMVRNNIFFTSFVHAINTHINKLLIELKQDPEIPVKVGDTELDKEVWGYFKREIYIRPANSQLYSGVIVEMFKRMKYKNDTGKWDIKFDKYFNNGILKEEWSFLYF